MATVNKRSKLLFSTIINGITAGGATLARIDAGYDEIVRSVADGTQVPYIERACQFVRGSQAWEDWTDAIGILTGTVGTSVFHERKSGTAAATGFIKHTLNNPVVHRFTLSQRQGQYLVASADFECRFASDTAQITDVWQMLDTQAAPSHPTAVRGGWRVVSAVFTPAGGSAINLYHVLSFNFDLAIRLVKACNDADKGYTAVDADIEAGIEAGGSISLEDSTIESTAILAARLVLAAKGTLVLTVLTGEGGANKTITIKGCQFGSGGRSLDPSKAFNDGSLGFTVANSSSTPLTLTGTDKIIAVA